MIHQAESNYRQACGKRFGQSGELMRLGGQSEGRSGKPEEYNGAITINSCERSQLPNRSDLETVAHLGAGPIDGMRRKFQNAGGFQEHFGDTEGTDIFLDPNDFLVLAEKNEVDREHHADGVNTARGHDTQASTELGPAPGFPKQSDEATKVTVGESCLRSDEGFPSPVINVHEATVTIIGHRCTDPVSELAARYSDPSQPRKNSYSMDLRLRRQMMMKRTRTANAPATTRISVTVSISCFSFSN